jgi:hypothetical protein
MKAAAMRRAYLREAAAMLLVARLAVQFVPPTRLLNWAKQPPRRIGRFAADEIKWTSWAIGSVGDRPWMNASCLVRALAATAMLRRRGIASRLCLGVVREQSALKAHAWLEVNEYKVTGGAEAAQYVRLAEFGGVPSSP